MHPAAVGCLLARVLVHLDGRAHHAACSAKPTKGLTTKHSVTQPCETERKACDLHTPSMIHGAQKREFPLNRDGRMTGHVACREQRCAAGTDGQPTEHPQELCLPVPSVALMGASSRHPSAVGPSGTASQCKARLLTILFSPSLREVLQTRRAPASQASLFPCELVPLKSPSLPILSCPSPLPRCPLSFQSHPFVL